MTSLFSALEGQPRRSAEALPPPTTDPFQAPDFGAAEAFPEAFPPEDAPAPARTPRPARRAPRTPRTPRPRAA
ncbi:hypothetical protein [Streptomyces sp. NPDC002265]|uniref:hypothetical protein n=1 Tax=Streptomyces sp. NPDC002265 TaxID=3154415 RepID=UPI0033231C60